MRKVISNITKQVKKFKPASLLQNKVLLYIVAAIAIVHILLLANSKDFNSVLIFVIVGFLISFFSKNMIVVLLSAIIFTAGNHASFSRTSSNSSYVNGIPFI